MGGLPALPGPPASPPQALAVVVLDGLRGVRHRRRDLRDGAGMECRRFQLSPGRDAALLPGSRLRAAGNEHVRQPVPGCRTVVPDGLGVWQAFRRRAGSLRIPIGTAALDSAIRAADRPLQWPAPPRRSLSSALHWLSWTAQAHTSTLQWPRRCSPSSLCAKWKRRRC